MDHYETIWIKKEEIEDVPNEPDSMVQVHSSSADVKEELEDSVNEESLEDPYGISNSSDFINNEPEVKLEVDETENIMVTSATCKPGNTRLIQNSAERCAISFEESVDHGVIHNELEKSAAETRHFAMFGSHRWELTEEDSTRLKCSSSEKECQEFSCLQRLPSDYRHIRQVSMDIDEVLPPKYVCNSCGEVFSSNISLNEHLKINEDGTAATADHSDKYHCIYTQQDIILDDREDPVREQTENLALSKENGKISESDGYVSYNTHTVTLNAGKRGKSDNYVTLCTTSNKNDQLVSLVADEVYKCDVCGKSFTQLRLLQRHALIHTGTRQFKCDICGKIFIRLSNLKQHALIHTGIRPHKCEVCLKSFTHLSTLKNHYALHTGIRAFKCDVCGKTFSQLGNLKQHNLIHTGIKSHTCVVCGRSFRHLSHLKSHAVMHAEVRPHKCDVCGKAFNRLGELRRHSSLHTGISPYKCSVCGKYFTHLSHLKRHALLHNEIRPYRCDVCGKTFIQSSYLKKHALTHK